MKLGRLQEKPPTAGERGKQKEHWVCNQKMGLPSLLLALLAVTIQASHFASREFVTLCVKTHSTKDLPKTCEDELR